MWDIETLEYQQLIDLRDAVNRRMLQLRRTTGLRLPDLLALLEEVKVTLRDQGKEWRSLERWQWMDGEVRFWLNPIDQNNYTMGWFSINELIQWTHNLGPVLIAADEEEYAEPLPWPEARALDLAA